MRIFTRNDLSTGAFGLLVGTATLWLATGIRQPFSYDGFGPATFPKIASVGLIVASIICLLNDRRADAEGQGFGKLIPVTIISAGLLIFALFAEIVGWIAMSAVIFLFGTVAFANRSYLVNAGIGLALGVVSYVLFSIGLDIFLPRGFIENAIRSLV